MKFSKTTLIHLAVLLILVSITNQFSLRAKRQEQEGDPSETDNAGPLDESLRLDELPVHDETELANIENDVQSTPDDEVVVSTPPTEEKLILPSDENSGNDEVEAELDQEENAKENSGDNGNEEISETTETNLMTNETVSNLEAEAEEKIMENETENPSETDEALETTEASETIIGDAESTSTQENITEETSENSEVSDSTESSVNEASESTNAESTQETTSVPEKTEPSVHDEDFEHFVDDPNNDQLLESNRIANDYENEIITTTTTTATTTRKEKATVWFKPTKSKVNDSYNDESHISANCPSLNCEFGYKTDLYGQPICSCFNPCHEKKCGSNVCKIEKLTESKYIGACYDPNKIERPLHCHLPLATGTCKNYTSRFYFNSFSQRCVHFVYTGCEGNQNNFDTWEKCEMECNTCSLPAARGPCKGNIIRYHYDPLRRECVAFNFGGCKGNENNFQTRKHCEDSCIFRKEGALFLHGMPVRVIRKYHREQDESQN